MIWKKGISKLGSKNEFGTEVECKGGEERGGEGEGREFLFRKTDLRPGNNLTLFINFR